jgi:hypothetical protein
MSRAATTDDRQCHLPVGFGWPELGIILGIIPKGGRFSAAIYVKFPKQVKPNSRFMFYVEQRTGGRLLGGSAYELRAHKEKPDRSGKKKKLDRSTKTQKPARSRQKRKTDRSGKK